MLILVWKKRKKKREERREKKRKERKEKAKLNNHHSIRPPPFYNPPLRISIRHHRTIRPKRIRKSKKIIDTFKIGIELQDIQDKIRTPFIKSQFHVLEVGTLNC